MFRIDATPFLSRLGHVLVRPQPTETGYAADASARAFVQFATACPAIESWCPLQRVRGVSAISGVLVATFDDEGRYGCADGSAHAAIALALVAPAPRASDWIEQVGYLEVLEQMRHAPTASMVVMPAHTRPEWLGPATAPLPYAPLRRRRLPFLGGDLRRAGRDATLCDDADQYWTVGLSRRLVEE
jgi:hypothetical protein